MDNLWFEIWLSWNEGFYYYWPAFQNCSVNAGFCFQVQSSTGSKHVSEKTWRSEVEQILESKNYDVKSKECNISYSKKPLGTKLGRIVHYDKKFLLNRCNDLLVF